MISDDKKEEIRAAADIVDVVGDYVKLKKSGSGFVGLCPFHDENTPSFHVTPRLGIYKCFGCGESGDVFNFVMEMEGIGFPESLRTLAERYGIDIPEDHTEEDSEETKKREGVLHALKFAGLFYHRQLLESPEAEKARSYLDSRGYPVKVWKNFGLGYSPSRSALLKEAQKEGIEEEYLLEADLIKPSNRNDGYFDSFRDRLMFPIFNPSGKLIAFAGRILNENKKTAKYINSSQTIVYNKSEVVYGVNFSKNEIRKEEEVILVEGYTDVITMHQKEIKNVVASSGTSLTAGQIKILQRYGKRIVMIYDADTAGQSAMERGMNIALEQGMKVRLMELPEGEDPDSFVKQYGKESFEDFKKDKAEDFVTFLVHKAERAGLLETDEMPEVIEDIVKSIANVPGELDKQFYIQQLHKKTSVYRPRGSDIELFEILDRIIRENKKQQRFSKRKEELKKTRELHIDQRGNESNQIRKTESKNKKRPEHELDIIRLLLDFGENMRRFIGHNIGEEHFEHEDMRLIFSDIMDRFKKGKEIDIDVYKNLEKPFPNIIADVVVERNQPSEKFAKRTGRIGKKHIKPYKVAKDNMSTLLQKYITRKKNEIADKLKSAEGDKREKLIQVQAKIQKEYTRILRSTPNELFDDPDFLKNDENHSGNVFEYKMKDEK